MGQSELPDSQVWGGGAGYAALGQVGDLCCKALDLEMAQGPSPDAFVSRQAKPGKPGVAQCAGNLQEGGVIAIELLLARCPGRLLVDAVILFPQLAQFNDKVRILPPRAESDGSVSLWAGLKVAAMPMSVARASAFHAELGRLDQVARQLQEHLPAAQAGERLLAAYKDFSDTLAPVSPWPAEPTGVLEELRHWSRQALDLLEGRANLALTSTHEVESDLALATLSALLMARGSSLATLVPPAINARSLLELNAKAPGVVALAANRLNLGASPYELGGEMRALLASLSQRGRPVIFTGSFDQLQSILHGGQGSQNDPLNPVVLRLPAQPLEPLTQFAVEQAAALAGGLPAGARQQAVAGILAALAGQPPSEQRRLLPMLASRGVGLWRRGQGQAADLGGYRRQLAGLSETFSGLSPRPRARRAPQVQDRLTRALVDEGLLAYLRQELLGQDQALAQLTARLRMEALTRPAHQPLRYCAQGTPGTGKSESAVLLARRLDIPYVNIDAASMPDFHTAASQLLGSGRGIVMSHLPGRLEQVAKHHDGCLVEISDLDHAPAQVRAPLADLFLQLLETGEAQSAAGGMFSCANLILAFTMNLPQGADEEVRKGIGFNGRPSRQEVRARVVKEIQRLLSGAFLSRVGQPILFEPLDGPALALVIERAVEQAIRAASRRFGLDLGQLGLEPGLGQKLLRGMETNLVSFGARAILEQGRGLAAEAFLRLDPQSLAGRSPSLRVYMDKEGNLAVEQV